MSETKTIRTDLEDAWALHELLRSQCDPLRLGEGNCCLLRKLQDVIMSLTFPNGVSTTEETAKYGVASHPIAAKKELALTLEEAWLITSNMGRTAYGGAQQLLLQVFFVLQQFSGLVPEPITELPPWMQEVQEGE